MQWLDSLAGTLLVSLGVDVSTRLGGSVQFLIYDLVKIMILLVILIFLVSYIQSYFPPERTRRILGRYRGFKGNLIGALLGTITPFCSCSSVPIFIGFSKAGLPIGVIFSFLISSPFVDLAALILLAGIFGIELAVVYVLMGVVLAVIGGTIMERLHMGDQIKDHARLMSDVPVSCRCNCSSKGSDMGRSERVSYSLNQVKSTISNVWIYIVIGVSIGALIHNWIPGDLIQAILGDGNPFSVIIATVIGMPIYADIFGTIPIAEALFEKGVEAGTILAFMMGVTATSIPAIAMLRGVCKTRLLITFLAIVLIGIIVMGYVFNLIQ